MSKFVPTMVEVTSDTFLRLAEAFAAYEQEDDPSYTRCRDLELEAFRALSGIPWEWAPHDDGRRKTITWAQYGPIGPTAPGNQVATFSQLTHDLTETMLVCLGNLPRTTRPQFKLDQDDRWEAKIVWTGRDSLRDPIVVQGADLAIALIRATLLARAVIPNPIRAAA